MTIMDAPSSGVKIRMYRQGHGDCFLLAFAGEKDGEDRPVYMLIDCGLKPGSQIKDQKIQEIISDIAKATDNYIDVVVVTHEHQDHVNGFLARVSRGKERCFEEIEIGRVWLAWTEDGTDEKANELRERFNDQLLALTFADKKLRGLRPDDERLEQISELLDLEIGDKDIRNKLVNKFIAAKNLNPGLGMSDIGQLAIKGIRNKTAIKYMRDKAEEPALFMSPEKGPYSIPNVEGINVFALGPPKDAELLLDLDPRQQEEFRMGRSAKPYALDGPTKSFLAAFTQDIDGKDAASPFSNRFTIPEDKVFDGADEQKDFAAHYAALYGGSKDGDPENSWRAIGSDWFEPAGALAIRLNNEVNNTSLVLAFSLPHSEKVLLFTGDAQRGNWISWADLRWDVDGKPESTKDLLGRCVFYKCGHHGSHNATLNGKFDDPYPNLSWFAQGEFADDFVALIPANTKWAMGKSKPWLHPQPAIEDALNQKTKGRVFRSDIDKVTRSPEISRAKWRTFKRNTSEQDLYFEYTIFDR